jgi:serine/threonine-protein kinase
VIAERYKVLAPIGRGGMGYVYRAEQVPLGRSVALKLMNPRYAKGRDPEHEQRFFLEAAVASKLTHPNTITIFDYGKDEDTLYIAMEYLSGRTLSRVLAEEGVFQWERAIHVTSQIAKGVREAHQRGVIHRDLKPANVMLIDHNDDKDFVKVLDFGLVKVFRNQEEEKQQDLTMTGIFLGSPKYMSPEQIKNHDPDPRSDVYALGVMLFQMLTGKTPFNHEEAVDLMLMHLHDAPPVPSSIHRGVPPAMDRVILRCLQKDRKARYESMDDLLAHLRAVRSELTGTPNTGSVSAISVSPGALTPSPTVVDFPPGAKQSKPAPARSPALVAVTAASVAAVVGVLLAALLNGWLAMSNAPKPTPPAPVTTLPAVPPPPPAPVLTTLPLMVTSEPAGANVRVEGRDMGVSPLLTEVGHAAHGRLRVTFSLSGYEPAEVETEAAEGKLRAHVVLIQNRASHPSTSSKEKGRSLSPAKKKLGSDVSDFKDDPY